MSAPFVAIPGPTDRCRYPLLTAMTPTAPLSRLQDEVPEGADAPVRFPSWVSSRREPLITAGIFLVYAGLALAAYWPVYPGDPNRIPTCLCGDPSLQTWFLGWVPYAIGHGHNVLYSAWTNYPSGVNLVQNTDMPLLGLLAAPITLLFGPISSYNLLLWLAFPASGTAMYWVCRRWTGSHLAAAFAGLLYGFSSYIVGQGVGHVMLSFVPIPPLYFYHFHKLVIRRGGPYKQGIIVGLLAVAQFFISSEIMASMILFSLIGLSAYVLAERRRLTRGDLLHIGRAGASAALLLLVVLAYPLWVVLNGPQHFPEPVRPVDNVYHGVGLGPILPTLSQRFSLPILSTYGHRLDPVENGQFLGLPLVLLALLTCAWYRKSRPILLAALLAVVAYVLSLGQHFGLTDLSGSFPMPDLVLGRIPLLNNLIPERLTLYTGLFVSILVAFGVAELIKTGSLTAGLTAQVRRGRQQLVRVTYAVGLGALTVVSLVPRWPVPSFAATVPPFFTSADRELIPRGSVVLTYPFPYYPLNQAMTWQAAADMRFKEVGTYAFIRGTDGRATTLPPLLDPSSVESFLIYEEVTPGTYPRPEISQLQLVDDVRSFVTKWRISAIVVDITDPTLRNTAPVVDTLSRAFGEPRAIGGLKLWLLPR